jgi:hypothetical protein
MVHIPAGRKFYSLSNETCIDQLGQEFFSLQGNSRSMYLIHKVSRFVIVIVFLSSGMAEILLVPVSQALVIPFVLFIVQKDSIFLSGIQ